MTTDDLAVLAFEHEWANRPDVGGAKEQAIADRFGLSAVRYYQRLNRVLDEPDAVAQFPHTVNRLRRIRAAGMKQRSRRW